MLSQTSIHLIRAFTYLATVSEEQYVGAATIAREIDAPQNYLGKVLQQFVLAGMLESQRGSGGGVRLVRSAEALTLFNIVDPVEHLSSQPRCFMGQLCCGPQPCEHHAAWEGLHNQYVQFLKNLTIMDLVKNNSLSTGQFMMPGKKREVIHAVNT